MKWVLPAALDTCLKGKQENNKYVPRLTSGLALLPGRLSRPDLTLHQAS